MNRKVACPNCLEVFDITPPAAGGKQTCPYCNSHFRLKTVNDIPTRIAGETKPYGKSPTAGTKSCPFCAETIQSAAKKCRYCNEFLDMNRQCRKPAPDIRFNGKRVRLPRGGSFSGKQCWMCGSPTDRQKTKKEFHYFPSWTAVLTLFSGLIGLIVMFACQKNTSVEIPMCRSCRGHWRLGTAVRYLYILLGAITLPILFGVVGTVIDPAGGLLAGTLLGFFTWISGIFVIELAWVRRKQASCTLIKDDFVELKFPRTDIIRRASKEGLSSD